MAFVWATKDPDEVLDYVHDWDLRLDGDTISSSSVIVETGDVVVDSQSYSGSEHTVWLSGGTADTDCILTLRIETAGGRTYDEGIRLKIKER